LATVTFTEVETEDYHGQILHANYLTSETWRHTSSGWKLAMVQTMAMLKDPPEVQLSPGDWLAYTGTYRAAPDLLYEVKIESGRLVGGLVGDAGASLHAELKDVFFIAGRPERERFFNAIPAERLPGMSTDARAKTSFGPKCPVKAHIKDR
jgi:hypothetical protein